MEHATLRVRRWDDCDVMFVDEAGVCRSYGEYWAPPGMLGGAPCLVIAALAPQCFRLDKTATDWVVEQGARTYLIESRYRHNTVDVYLLDPGYYFYPRRDYARTNAGYSDPEAKSVELYQDHDRYKMMTAAERAERAEGERAVRAERAHGPSGSSKSSASAPSARGPSRPSAPSAPRVTESSATEPSASGPSAPSASRPSARRRQNVPYRKPATPASPAPPARAECLARCAAYLASCSSPPAAPLRAEHSRFVRPP